MKCISDNANTGNRGARNNSSRKMWKRLAVCLCMCVKGSCRSAEGYERRQQAGGVRVCVCAGLGEVVGVSGFVQKNS